MEKDSEKDGLKPSKICCFMSSFPPRECGIATFTQDLSSAMNKKWNPRLKSRILALDEEASYYNYNNKVLMQMNSEDIESYINIAKKINHSKKIKIVSIQHEFGLFGGKYGDYIIPFLETIKKPVLVTFHSVLPNPDDVRKRIVRFICDKSAGTIVMAQKAVDILKNDYGVPEEKIHVVYHGIPTVPFQKNEHFKKKLKLDGKIVLSTFGLLGRGKGIEYVIRSLSNLVKKYPNLLYLVMGQTHPGVSKKEGESYRNELIAEVEKLGLQKNVKFYNKYMALQEIIDYLLASDAYICTNLEKAQIVSGTLSYAMGCGRAVISTPIVYAEEVLDNEKGIVIRETKDPQSYEEAIDKLLSNPDLKDRIEKNAYAFSRQMIWPNVARKYLKIFNKVENLREDTTEKYPYIKLNHLRNLTTENGVIQFSKHSTPDKSSGYTTDDNARALIVAVNHNSLFKSKNSKYLAKIYMNFLEKAQEEDGHFKNNFQNENETLDSHSEDALGRAIWSLGFTLNKTNNPELKEKAKELFDNSQNKINELESPRAKAFAINGLYHYYKEHPNTELLFKIRKLADDLVKLYETQSAEDWCWFEPYLTYSNAKMPEALYFAYELTGDNKYLEIAEKTLKFLSELLIINGKLSPVGQNGWCNRNGERAFYDQQPVDASAMVQIFLTAYSITKNKEHYDNAVLSFNWFLGKNHLGQMIYDEITGGCYDGVLEECVNLNQGAESTICYLISRLFIEESKRNKLNQDSDI